MQYFNTASNTPFLRTLLENVLQAPVQMTVWKNIFLETNPRCVERDFNLHYQPRLTLLV